MFPAFVEGPQGATGSLSVGGVSFATAGATVSWPDEGRTLTLEPHAASGLAFQQGTMASVRGEIDSPRTGGTAAEVVVRCVVRGAVASRTASSLTVAGADVRLDARTALLDASGAPTTLASLPDGAPVEVHGWPEAGARVRASLLRILPVTTPALVRGWTRAAPSNGVFEVSLLRGGPAVVRVSAAGVPLGGIAPDALVRVTGDLTPGAPPTLTATSVAVESELLAREDDSVLLDGVASAIAGSELVIGSHRVRPTASTAWSGLPPAGSPGEDLFPGTRLAVKGFLLSGVVVATDITVVDLQVLSGRIAPGSLAVGNPAEYAVFTLTGTTVVADTSTTLAGADGTPLTVAELASLQAGSASGLAVVVHGYQRADATVQAQRLVVSGT